MLVTISDAVSPVLGLWQSASMGSKSHALGLARRTPINSQSVLNLGQAWSSPALKSTA
jgi:hypothetical protein